MTKRVVRGFLRSLILILSTGLLLALCQAAPPAVIRSIGEVNRLSQNEASAALPVRLTGVVTYSDQEWGLLFVEDATGALFVNTKGTAVNVPPGTRVTVEATTAPGDLAPVVTRPVVKVLGAAPMPAPVPASINDLEAGRLDSRWVEVSGVVRLNPRKWDRTSFLLHRGGVATWVMLPRPDDGLAERFVDAVVRIRGVCGSRIRHGQRVGAQLFVSRPEDIVVEEPAPKNPLLIPETPAGEDLVRMSGLPYVRRVRIRGEVTYRQPGVVWVENRSGATPVMVSEEPTLAPGDAVDAIGFPAQTSYGVGLQDAHLTRREASPPSQRPLHSAEQVIAGKMHGRLVRLRAQVIEQSAGAGAGTLLLGSGAARFTAKLSRGIGMALPRDTVVEITGVAMLVERPGHAVPSFSVLVRDLKVLHQAGAMALEQVILVVLSISVLAVAALAWLTLLRRTVRRQTALIRARLEREAQLESDYRRLFERNPAGVFRWRPDGTIVDCNPAFAAMLAGSRDTLPGRSYWDFETDAEARAGLLNLKAGDAVASREVCLRTVAGGERWLIEHVCLVETPDGLLYEATAVDVTDRRRYREELRNAKDELEQRVRERTADLESEIIRRERIEKELIGAKQQAEGMSRAKSTFLANMSHELRTPLNAVIGYSEILAEDAQAAGKPEFLPDLERIRGAGKHLLALINDVLDLSKIEAGRMEVRKERFTVDAMVKDVLATVEPMARKTGNTLRADYGAAPLDIVADATKFRQSLLNLLSNACKFTDGGEVNLTVKTVPGEGQDWVEWAVCDTGIGISPENQARLFQAFSQVSNATSRKFSGTGLGLAISKRYCQLMGGDITFSSEPGQGSRFVIRVPASPPESSAHGQTQTSAPAHPPD